LTFILSSFTHRHLHIILHSISYNSSISKHQRNTHNIHNNIKINISTCIRENATHP